MANIRFGTDGWRAIAGEDFIPDNVARVIQAFCDVHRDALNKTVYVGFDRRRDSASSAELVASVLAANGFTPYLSESFCPTPCVSWMVKTHKALAGIIITASHNPSQWNGVKFKESYGGAASPEYTAQIEKMIDATSSPKKSGDYPSYQSLRNENRIRLFDPKNEYAGHLRRFINVDLIRKSGFKIAVDPLFGAGTGFFEAILEVPVTEIHSETDPSFGGLNPEPIEKNLVALKKAVLENHADVGFSTDGDADRIGAMDENGEFVNSHQIFALLLKHHINYRKLRGTIVKSISTTGWIDRICNKYGLSLIETPIGFKYISKELKNRDALMGGEESGGISFRDHVHERDGVLNGLLLAEMMAVHGKKLTGLLEDLYREFGRLHFARDDYHIPQEKIRAIRERAEKRGIQEIGGVNVSRYDLRDGAKICFEDASWLLIRGSGTEPLLRVYAEAADPHRVRSLLDFAREYFQL